MENLFKMNLWNLLQANALEQIFFTYLTNLLFCHLFCRHWAGLLRYAWVWEPFIKKACLTKIWCQRYLKLIQSVHLFNNVFYSEQYCNCLMTFDYFVEHLPDRIWYSMPRRIWKCLWKILGARNVLRGDLWC